MAKQNIVVNGAVNEKALEEFYQEAMNIALGAQPFSIHEQEKKFSASSSICEKETLLSGIIPHLKKPLTEKTKRTFSLGHKFHKLADDGADSVLWRYRGEIMRITPFQVVCFPELFEDTPMEGVLGTPDHLLYFPLERVLVLNDQKSEADFSFGKVKKEGTSVHHGIQVGAYYDGLMRSPLRGLVDKCAVYICHLAKSHGTAKMTHADAMKITKSREFWERVAVSYKRFLELGHIPGEVQPVTSWACRYCKFFEDWDQCKGCTTLENLEEVLS